MTKQPLRTLAISFFAAATLLGSSAASAHPNRIHIPKPKIVVGATAGEITAEGSLSGQSLGLSGRLDFGRLALSADLSKTDYGDQWRVDRYLGVGLYARLARRGRLRLFAHGGAGVNLVEFGGEPASEQVSGQLGIGVALGLSDRLDVTLEGIAGKRETVRRHSETIIPLFIPIPTGEEFTHTRIGLSLSF